MRNYTGIIIAVLLALVVGFAILKFSGGTKTTDTNIVATPQKAAPVVQTVDILVAMKDIPIGSKLDESLFDKQPWPANLVLDQFIEADKQANIIGMVTRSPFQAREPLIMSKLANPNDPSFLAASIPHGMRAVTLGTDAIQGVAGFVFPGDRVDVLYTHDVPQDIGLRTLTNSAGNVAIAAYKQPDKMTEMLLPNLRVLAVDQRPTSTTGEKIVPPTSITVETTMEDAQKIRLAEKHGTLSVTLRSLADKDTTETTSPTLVTDVMHGGTGGNGEQKTILVERGIKSETVGVNAPPSMANNSNNAQHAQ